MDHHVIIGYLSGGFELIGTLPYAYAIFTKKIKPSRASWFIWSLSGLILIFSYYGSGARETLWQPAVAGAFNIFFALLSLKYGVGGTTKLDLFCFAGAVFSAVVWYFTNNPVVGMTFITIIGIIGAIPTIAKACKKPETESALVWGFWSLAGIFNVIAIKNWSFAIAFYPLESVIFPGAIFLLTFRKIFRKELHNN